MKSKELSPQSAQRTQRRTFLGKERKDFTTKVRHGGCIERTLRPLRRFFDEEIWNTVLTEKTDFRELRTGLPSQAGAWEGEKNKDKVMRDRSPFVENEGALYL